MFRRSLGVAILAGTAWFLTPGIDYAKGGGGSGGHGGGSMHGGGGYYHNGYYHHYYPGIWGIGLGYWPYGYGYGYGPGYNDGGNSAPDVAPAAGYVTPPPSIAPQPPPDGYAQGPGLDPTTAGFVVLVPDPNAEVWFQNSPTKQRGNVREYESGSLRPGRTYTFQVRARWTQNGQVVDRAQNVQARGGQVSRVAFTARESVPAPPPSPGK